MSFDLALTTDSASVPVGRSTADGEQHPKVTLGLYSPQLSPEPFSFHHFLRVAPPGFCDVSLGYYKEIMLH